MLADVAEKRQAIGEKREARSDNPSKRLISVPWLLGFLWLGSYLALALLDIWLREVRGAVSSELLFWEAQRRLVVSGHPAHLAALVENSPPLAFYGVLLAGSALNFAALLGATAITALAAQLQRTGAPLLWLPLLALHPAIVVVAAQYPSVLLRSLLLLVTLSHLVEYVRDDVAYQLSIAALCLSALTLVDLQLWPMWLYIAAVLVTMRKRTAQDRITLLLVSLFPAVFLSLAWLYLRWVAIGAGARSSVSWTTETSALIWQAWPGLLIVLVLFTPAYLALLLLLALRGRRLARQAHAMIFILAIPLLDVVLRYATGRVPGIADNPLSAAPLLLVLPILSVPLLWKTITSTSREHTDSRQNAVLRGMVGVLLLVSLVGSWASVARGQASEPQALLRRAIGQPAPLALDSFQKIADALNERAQPGQRVLFDDRELFPLVTLINRSDALLLPYQTEYALAVQQPADWAEFVVIAAANRAHVEIPQALAGYTLVLQSGDLQLYQRQHAFSALSLRPKEGTP